MDKRQKNVILELAAVLIVTIVAVVAMINVKDIVNRSEAMRAMEMLGQRILTYRQERGSLPPESFLDSIKEELPGRARLGKVNYRALWIDFDSTGDKILAYVKLDYNSLFVAKGYMVMTLDGRVEYMETQSFEALLKEQQTQAEIDMLGQQTDGHF